MSIHSQDWVLFQYFFVIGLVVDLHGGEHADNGAIEGYGEDEIVMLVAECSALNARGANGTRHLLEI
jgi:hypothetical protein